ncbi:MAG: tyrosine recombinase XerC [Armatimonadetes bacterium]|nr:tyrosine recombinase XerC [Armatimonadota bacterium]
MEEKGSYREAIEWYLDALIHEKGASEHTVTSYERDLHLAADFFTQRGRNGWEALTAEDLNKFQNFAAEGYAPTTARRRVSALRSFLKFLKKNGEGPETALPSAAGIRLPKRLPKALSVDDLLKLLDAPDLATPVGLRDRTLMELVYGTGLRVSEATNLRTDEVDMDAAAFRVKGKRGKIRFVPIPMHTAPWLERYLNEARPQIAKRANAYVFLGARGGPLSRQSAYNIFEQYRRQAGLRQAVSPHTLRHTYAVHLVRGGADLRAVQELLGHSSISTTQIYTMLDLDVVREHYDKAHPRR